MPRSMLSAPHPRPILRRNTKNRVPAACAATPPQATTRSCTAHDARQPNTVLTRWTQPARRPFSTQSHLGHGAIQRSRTRPHGRASPPRTCACTRQVRTHPCRSHLATTTTTLTNCKVLSIALQPTTERLHPSLNSKQPTFEAKRQARRRGDARAPACPESAKGTGHVKK